jgi:hypothetical protein
MEAARPDQARSALISGSGPQPVSAGFSSGERDIALNAAALVEQCAQDT